MADCTYSSHEPKVVDPREQSSWTEHSLGANDSPNNTGVVESCGARASKALRLVFRTELRDVANKEVESSDLDKRQPDHSEELRPEHGSGWDFHLQVN